MAPLPHRALSLLLGSLCFALASPALADDPEPEAPKSAAPKPAPMRLDIVRLRNGGQQRGRVTEIVPEDHVTIIDERDGQTKDVAWTAIERVIIGGPPRPATGVSQAATVGTTPSTGHLPSPPTPKAAMQGPLAKVHIAAPSRVILYRRPAGSSTWEVACDSPCDERLPLNDDYRLTGNGVAQSEEFKLMAAPDGSVYVNVHSSNAGRVLGGVLAGVGALVGYVGLLVALSNSSSYEKDERATGLVALGLGSAAALTGIVLFLVTGGTDVTQTIGGKEGKEARVRLPLPTTPSKPLDAFVRVPEKSSTTRLSSDPAVLAPPPAFPLVFTKQF